MKKIYLLFILCTLSAYYASAQKIDSVHVFLDSIFMELPEVLIKGERPIVKVEEGRLSYDVPRLVQDKTVSNAFEAIKEIPGIITQGDELSLAGSRSLNIILNGQLTSMNYSQLISLLKSVPASRIEKAEIMYSAPPQYNIRGSLINIVLKQSDGENNTFQGEAAADYTQAFYGRSSARLNLLYSTPKLTLDFLYANNWNKIRSGEDMLALHTLESKLYNIEQTNRGKTERMNHNVRLGAGYQFDNGDKLNLVYTGIYDNTDSKRMADIKFSTEDNAELKEIHSDNRTKGPSFLHNAKLEYSSYFGLVAGVDYTYYKDNSDQDLVNRERSEEDVFIGSSSEQSIHKAMLFANQTHHLPHEWILNYGTNVSFSYNDSYSDNWINNDFDEKNSFKSIQEEITANVFMGFTKSFTEQLSVQASIAGEYYKSTEEVKGQKNTLWDNIALFPNINANYVINPSHILQLAFSCDKSYPSYWAINPSTLYLNAYSVVQGNPQLIPSRDYNTQLSYIYKQKYVLVAFVNHTTDYFAQLPWQSSSELKNIFSVKNFDYNRQIGLSLIVPFRIGEIIDSRLTLNGLQMHQKSSHFYDTSFDRKKLFGVAMLRNTVKLSANPDLKLDISGYYTSPAIQGIYDLGSTYDVSAGIKWTFAREKAELMLRCKDIFNSNNPTTNIDYENQRSRMELVKDSRNFSVSFVYKFGGFKEAKKDEVDRSRFGR